MAGLAADLRLLTAITDAIPYPSTALAAAGLAVSRRILDLVRTLPVPGAQGAQHPERSRIRDLGKITMVRDRTRAETGKLYPHAGPLLSARWNEDWSLTAGATSCAWPGR